MTDYKDYGRIPRPLPEIHFNRILMLLLIVFILVGLSIAGHEDMEAQVVIDKQIIHEQVKQNMDRHDQELVKYFVDRSR